MAKAYVVKTFYYEDGVRRSHPIIHDSLRNGKARIGWSSDDDHDLRILKETIGRGEWKSLRPDQQDAARCLGFLERVKGEDLLIYPHQPEPNRLLIAQVIDGPEGEYGYSPAEETLDGDFRSYRGCKLLTEDPVPYNDTFVLPYVQSRLGLQGRFYELKDIEKLRFTLERLHHIPKFAQKPQRNLGVRLNRIRDAISPKLPVLIQQEFLRHDLSWFCTELFRTLGYSVRNQEGAGEYGSDLIVEIRSELLPRSLRVGVQIKSYTDTVSLATFQRDLQPLIDGWEKNVLDYGVYLTTAMCEPTCLDHLQDHNANRPDRQIVLIDSPALGHLLFKAVGRFGNDEE